MHLTIESLEECDSLSNDENEYLQKKVKKVIICSKKKENKMIDSVLLKKVPPSYYDLLKNASKYCVNGTICNEAIDAAYEEACLIVSESVGPNSIEYDSLVEKHYEELLFRLEEKSKRDEEQKCLE